LIKIRLQRKGRIRRPIYHIVVADSRSPRDGRIIEQVGRYDGVTEKKETKINEERISYWLDNGAKPTDAVQKILRHQGFLFKRHLQMWGKSEEEINAALEEWKANRASKAQTEVTRKEQVRAGLIAEEKEVKKQIEQQASAAAAEMAKETEEKAEAEAAEPTNAVEGTENEAADVAAPEVESSAEEAPTEQESSEQEETIADETATQETKAEVETEEKEAAENEAADVAGPEVEASAEEATTEQEAPEEAETTAEDTPAEQPEQAEAEATEPSGKSSADMTAKEAAQYIAATSLEELDGFVAESEERKTVLAAWEAKKNA
jgi:small subunit ribosomal protein S16